MFSLQHNWRTRGQNRFCPEVRVRGEVMGMGQGGEVAPIMYTHMNKCKSVKKKF
jgi:hypothetical protein